MTSEQNEALIKINEQQEKLADLWLNYWQQFSSLDSWQFWFHFIIFIAPLIIIYFKIDRRKAFEVGFYGFNVHVWFGYFDAIGTRHPFWNYPFQIFPFIPNSIGLDASLVPVLFMLVYQWTQNSKKNYYIYTLILSVVMAFIVKPILVSFDLFKFSNGANFLHLFLTYIVILCLSKWLTNLFKYFQNSSSKSLGPT